MSTGMTPVKLFVTAVKYEVDEHNLMEWLSKEFGSDATHEVCRSVRLGCRILILQVASIR